MKKSITEHKLICPNPKCKLVYKVKDCVPDIDGDGGIGCPRCWDILREVHLMQERTGQWT